MDLSTPDAPGSYQGGAYGLGVGYRMQIRLLDGRQLDGWLKTWTEADGQPSVLLLDADAGGTIAVRWEAIATYRCEKP
jgi:hypothetical protein